MAMVEFIDWRSSLKVRFCGKRLEPSIRVVADDSLLARFLLEVAFTRIRVEEAASNLYRHRNVRCFACDSGTAKFDRIVFEQPFPSPMPDMFVAHNLTARVWVTDRVKRLIEDNGFSGVHFVAPEDYKLDDPLYREPGDIAMAKIKDPEAFLKEHIKRLDEEQRRYNARRN